MNARQIVNIKKFASSKNIVLYLLVFLVVLMSVLIGNFLTFDNVRNIFISFSVYGVTTIAMTFAIICGEFDLSVGSIMAMTSLIFAKVTGSSGLLAGMLLGLLIGFAVGALNGVIIAKGKIPSFVATLGTSIVIKGIALYYTDGYQVPVYDDVAFKIGNGMIAQIPYLVLIFFSLLLIAWFVLKYTRFGRNIYAVGGSFEMAKLAGIKADFYKFIIFIILGVSASISGVMMTCRIAAGNALYGTDLTMSAVSAVVIGGTSLIGGTGGVWRTLAGLLVMSILFNALTLLGMQAYIQQLFRGLIVIVVVVTDALIRKREEE